MQNSLCVSFATSHGVSSVVLMYEGKLVAKTTKQIADAEVLKSSYSCLLDTFSKALRLTRSFIDKHSTVVNVVFEVNNSTFIKWFDKGYSKEQYQDLFISDMDLLNEIPMNYIFSYNKKPMAVQFLNSLDKVSYASWGDE